MNQTPKPSAIVLMASGAVTFLFSFLPFFSGSGASKNGWSTDVGTMFMVTWPALIGLAIAVLVAITTFADVELPDNVLTFNWPQIYTALSFAGLLIMIGYLFGGGMVNFGFAGSPGKGFGFFIMLLGSIGLMAGSIMELLDLGGDGAPSGSPGQQGPTSF